MFIWKILANGHLSRFNKINNTLNQTQLTNKNRFLQEQLVEPSQLYKQVMPGAFIRQVSQQNKSYHIDHIRDKLQVINLSPFYS